jgi:hypothetical protein
MSKFSIRPPAAVQEPGQRFAAPGTTARNEAPNPVQPDAPAPISAELAVLLGPGMQRDPSRKVRYLRPPIDAAARQQSRDLAHDGDVSGEGPTGVTNFAYAGQQQSSRQHGDGSGHEAESQPRRLFDQETSFQVGEHHSRLQLATHMANSAADLPQRCTAHRLSHGSDAMPRFLRGAMVDLLPGFMRDLAERFDHLAASTSALHPADAIRPVAEVCQDFLNLLRPMYLDHVSFQGPYLVTDVQTVLCAAQTLLGDEMAKRGADNPGLARILRETVYPLWPILVMACLPRPSQESREPVEPFREASA